MTRQLLSLGFFFVVLTAFVCALLSGCTVNIRGEPQPLVTHGPIRGDVELVAEQRDDSQGTSGNEIKSKSETFEEKWHLKTQGNVYNDNFLFYNAALGFGYIQQNLNSDIASGSKDGTLKEYNLVAEFLRLKPYPVTVYANKSQDMVERQFLGPLRTDTQNSGFSTALRSEDWPMRFQYSKSETTQNSLFSTSTDFFKRDATDFKYALGHNFSELSHLNFDFSHDDVTQQGVVSLINTNQDRYTLSHDQAFGSDAQHRLDSFFSYLNQTGTTSFTNLQWEERLTLQHTPSFLTNYDFRYTDTTLENSSEKETHGLIGFEHRLFESLVTTGSVFASETTLDSSGSTNQQGGSLGVNYHKKNSWGTLYLTYAANLIESRSTSGSAKQRVINEPHIFTDPLPITLDKSNIDTTTIVVTDSTGLNTYTEGDDYTVTVVGDRVELIVTTLGIIPPNVINGQQLLVSYSFTAASRTDEETVRQDFTIRQAFENGLGLYGAHRQQDQQLKSTDPCAKPDDFTINTFGVDYTNKGLFLLAESTKEESTQIPSTTKRVDARYSWPLNVDTRTTLYASDDWLNFGAPDNRDVTLFRTGAEISTRLTERYSLSGRVDYRDETDSRFGKTEGFQFSSELQYSYRQFILTAGVELTSLNRSDNLTKGDYIYLRLKRFF